MTGTGILNNIHESLNKKKICVVHGNVPVPVHNSKIIIPFGYSKNDPNSLNSDPVTDPDPAFQVNPDLDVENCGSSPDPGF